MSPATAGVPSDHPRIRGEHAFGTHRVPIDVGSSPHTRGARVATPPYPAASRIIPAYAGSTLSAASGWLSGGDHPRIRGEHRTSWTFHASICGSSPHTRGAPLAQIDPRQVGRIIPAYAGSTASPPSMTAVRRDHPRIRGEHISRSRWVMCSAGSSPHTRGAPPGYH